MRDGRILWTRSEYLDKGANFGHTLWAIHPDGTHPELIFGNDTINCYMNGREVPGSREICCTIISHGGDHNGPLGLIDLSKGPFDSAAPDEHHPRRRSALRHELAGPGVLPRPGADLAATISSPATPRPTAGACSWSIATAIASCCTWTRRSAACALRRCGRRLGRRSWAPLEPKARRGGARAIHGGRRVPGAGARGAAGQGEVHPRLPGGPFDAGATAQRRVPQGPRARVPGFLRLAGPPGERPVRLAELRGQGLAGHRAGRGRRLGEFLRPGREGALFPGPRREPQRNPADAERGAIAAGRAAQLRGLPRRPAIRAAAQALAGCPAAAEPARRAVLGRRGVLLRGGRPAGVERPVRFLPRRGRQAQDEPHRHALGPTACPPPTAP